MGCEKQVKNVSLSSWFRYHLSKVEIIYNVDHFLIDCGSKLAEQIVKRRIRDYGDEANVIPFNRKQFVYMKKARSTVTQLGKSSQQEKSNGRISLRLLQSVRQCPTDIDLLHRLERYGIDGPLLN